MTNIIVVFPKPEDAKSIRNILVRNGFQVAGVCFTGAQAMAQADGLSDGIIICCYKMADMIYSELHENLPSDFEMILIASRQWLAECEADDIVRLEMPLKVGNLIETVGMLVENIERRKRRRKNRPRVRSEEEENLISKAKGLLMERNHMTEEEAHRYIQKCSMDSGTNMVESAQMVLSLYN